MKQYRDNRGRSCHVCDHPRRPEIELRIANRTPAQTIADAYGISKDSVWRHRRNHMPDELVTQLQARGHRTSATDLEQLKESESEGLLQTLVYERSRQQRLADKAEALDQYSVATRASVAALKSSELIAKLLGDIQTGNKTINVMLSPEFLAFRTAVIQALRPYRDAKLAVLQKLQLVEHKEGVIDGEFTQTTD